MTAAPQRRLLLTSAHVRRSSHASAVSEGKDGAARSCGGEGGLAKSNEADPHNQPSDDRYQSDDNNVIHAVVAGRRGGRQVGPSHTPSERRHLSPGRVQPALDSRHSVAAQRASQQESAGQARLLLLSWSTVAVGHHHRCTVPFKDLVNHGHHSQRH